MTGIICMWSGAIVDIPDGWLLCDGNNGTPDLTDRFIVGAGDSYDPADTGGSLSHDHDLETTSDEENMVHSHDFATLSSSPAAGSYNVTDIGGTVQQYSTHTHNIADTTDSQLGLHAHDVFGFTEPQDTRPKYYALAFIMKT